MVAPPKSVVDALEVDLSHPFQDDLATGATIEHELECVYNSVGDVGDGTGLTVVERAVDAQSHDCVEGVQVDGLCLWRFSMMAGQSQIQTQTVLFVLAEMITVRTQPKRTIVIPW